MLAAPMTADEGMWLFNQFPQEAVKQKHSFDVTPAYLDSLRLASVRIGGGSGSFVSPGGLLLTNQHLVASCLAKTGHLKDGFYAASQTAEIACPGLEARVLVNLTDVTAQVKAGGFKECADCTVVKLYSGARYDLYQYKVYRDVRLVFAPEEALAFFGRERDSITYLRYGLDIAFLRAYENGKPAATPHYLKWSAEGMKEGDLVFAAGNPAATARSTTAAQLTFYRDTALPITIARLQPRIRALAGTESAALTALIESYKSAAGKLIGLRDDRLVGRKTIFDHKIRNAVERDPALGAEAGKVWDQIAAAYKTWAPFEKSYQILTGPPLMVDAPMDEATKTALLAEHQKELKAISGKEAAIRKKHEEVIGSVEASAAEKIAGYRFRLFGAADYPDATGTPRVEFGVVKGYIDRAGVPAPYAATFSGLYYRRNNEGPYQVPPRWVDAQNKLNAVTPLDFVSTCDIGGGDAGSPTVNGAGELVGVIFDGNLESMPNTYLYVEEQARAVHVAVQGIAEALSKVYGASELLRELGGAGFQPAQSFSSPPVPPASTTRTP